MAKAVTTTIKDSFFDDPFFKASKQKMINNHITYRYTDPSRQFFEKLLLGPAICQNLCVENIATNL